MRTAITLDGTFESTADGGDVVTARNGTLQFRVYGEEVQDHIALGITSRLTATGKDELFDNGAQSVVDAKTGFVPRIEGEKDGVVREPVYAFGKEGADVRGSEQMSMGGVMVEQPRKGLMKVLVMGRAGSQMDGEKCYARFEVRSRCRKTSRFHVCEQHQTLHRESCLTVQAQREHAVTYVKESL